VDYFIGELHQRMEGVQAALEAGDRGRIRALVHQLKGAGGGYGYPGITAAAAEVEAAAVSQTTSLSELAAKVESLVALCRRATLAA
jgi:HPt (histidine-containing phosphotransfer) domain-containing protein